MTLSFNPPAMILPSAGVNLLNQGYYAGTQLVPGPKATSARTADLIKRMGLPHEKIFISKHKSDTDDAERGSMAAYMGAQPEEALEYLHKEYPGSKGKDYTVLMDPKDKMRILAHELGHIKGYEGWSNVFGKDLRNLSTNLYQMGNLGTAIGTAGGGLLGHGPTAAIGTALAVPQLVDEIVASHHGGVGMASDPARKTMMSKIRGYLGPYSGVPTYLAAMTTPGLSYAVNQLMRQPNQRSGPFQKMGDIRPEIQMQPHQARLESGAQGEPSRKLLFHSLGSGKTLSALGMAEAQKEPYTAIAPAALRANWKSEMQKFTDAKTPQHVMSYSELARGKPVPYQNSLIFDEAHRLRNMGTSQTTQALRAAEKARQVTLLTGSPVVNDPQDLAVPTRMLTGQKMNPQQFRQRYVGEKEVYPGFFASLRGVPAGREEDIQNANELKALLRGHVDYYAPHSTTVPVKHENHDVEMGLEQSQIYRGMWEKLPWHIRWKLRNDFPMNSEELQRSVSFLTGPRQVSLSPYPYMREKDPIKAFHMSPKLVTAFGKLQEHLKHPQKKALIFSNYIDAGLTPYSAKLTEQGIPNALFHGGLNDQQRKQLVEDFNHGKIRVALVGPSGSEGLSFRGTQLIQMLDPYWNQTRTNQMQGRGLRFDSHTGLPEDLKDVTVQQFSSKLPLGFKDRLLSRIGFDRSRQASGADAYLSQMSARKQKLNEKFLNLLKEVGSEGQTRKVNKI